MIRKSSAVCQRGGKWKPCSTVDSFWLSIVLKRWSQIKRSILRISLRWYGIYVWQVTHFLLYITRNFITSFVHFGKGKITKSTYIYLSHLKKYSPKMKASVLKMTTVPVGLIVTVGPYMHVVASLYCPSLVCSCKKNL